MRSNRRKFSKQAAHVLFLKARATSRRPGLIMRSLQRSLTSKALPYQANFLPVQRALGCAKCSPRQPTSRSQFRPLAAQVKEATLVQQTLCVHYYSGFNRATRRSCLYSSSCLHIAHPLIPLSGVEAVARLAFPGQSKTSECSFQSIVPLTKIKRCSPT